MSKFVLSAFLAIGVLAGPVSTIAKAFEIPAQSIDQQKEDSWAVGYWEWLQQNAGG